MLKVLSPYNIEAQRYVVIEQKVLQCSIHYPYPDLNLTMITG